jgi:hypothetical protein
MQILGGEHSVELLKIFNQEVEREITTTSEFAAEEEAKNKDFVEYCVRNLNSPQHLFNLKRVG